MRKRVFTKSPVRENCTPGSVRGLSGNWQSYRDRWGEIKSVFCCTSNLNPLFEALRKVNWQWIFN